MSGRNLGIIGYNEGNGHPYSFSAIINGYDKKAISQCPYPVIANYLSVRKEEEFGVHDFTITHVWCPEKAQAYDIAKCTHIDTVVDSFEEMLGHVDAVIIARDDPGSHRRIGGFFLEAGLKVFIDKPLCSNLDDLDYFQPYLEQGLLMSCSGFRYFPPINAHFENPAIKESVLFAQAYTSLDWYKYGIHMLEGLVPVLGSDIVSVRNLGNKEIDIVLVEYKSRKYAIIQKNPQIQEGMHVTIYTTDNKHKTFYYDDNFSCFRALLFEFYDFCINGRNVIEPTQTAALISALIEGGVKND